MAQPLSSGSARAFKPTAPLFLVLALIAGSVLALPGARADTSIAAAVLPVSRSVTINENATLFASIVNAGSETATDCRITNDPQLSGSFSYQTTDSATNTITGTLNTPVDIPVGGVQSFIISLSSNIEVPPTDVAFGFVCSNSSSAPVFPGVNTLLFSASADSVPDLIALGATLSGAGTIVMPDPQSAAAFSVASINVGAAAELTVEARTSRADLPLQIALCQTNPATGACLANPSSNNLAYSAAAGDTGTFGVFVTSSDTVPFDPANNRIFVRFLDANGLVRGATSVAIRLRNASDPLAIDTDNAVELVDSSLADFDFLFNLFYRGITDLRQLTLNPLQEITCFSPDGMEIRRLTDVDGSNSLSVGDLINTSFETCRLNNSSAILTGSVQTQIEELLIGSDATGLVIAGRLSTAQPIVWNSDGDTLTIDVEFRYVRQDRRASLTLGSTTGTAVNSLEVTRGNLTNRYRNLLLSQNGDTSSSEFSVGLSFATSTESLRGTAQCDSTLITRTNRFGGSTAGDSGVLTCTSVDGTGLRLQTALNQIELDSGNTGSFNSGVVDYPFGEASGEASISAARSVFLGSAEFFRPEAPGLMEVRLAVTTGAVSEANNRVYVANPIGLLVIDPDTGQIEETISSVNTITSIAVSDDGEIAYLGYAETGTVQSLNLRTGELGAEFSIGISSEGGVFEAGFMRVVPGTTDQVVVARENSRQSREDLVLYINGQAAPTRFEASFSSITNAAFAGDSQLYVSTSSGLYNVSVTSFGSEAGLDEGAERVEAIFSNNFQASGFGSSGGLLYGGVGLLFDPATNRKLGRFVPRDGSFGFDVMTYNAESARAYLLDDEELSIFDGTTFTELGRYEISEDSISSFNLLGFELLNTKLVVIQNTSLIFIDLSQLPEITRNNCQSIRLADALSTSAGNYQSCVPNDLVFHAPSNRFVAALSSTVGSQGNSLAIIVPETGAIERTISVGSEPNSLAVSADEDLVYVVFEDRNTLTEVNLVNDVTRDLVSFASRRQAGFGDDLTTEVTLPQATIVSASPLDNGTLMLHFSDRTTALYRDSMLFESADSQFSQFSQFQSLTFSPDDPSRGFGLDGSNSLQLLDIDQTGISTGTQIRDLLEGRDAVFSNGFFYTTGLQKFDPNTLAVVQNYEVPELGRNDQAEAVFRLGDRLLALFNLFDRGVFVATFDEETGEYIGQRIPPQFGDFFDRGFGSSPQVTVGGEQWVALANDNGIIIIPQEELIAE